jgi:2'-5' RNA ligase
MSRYAVALLLPGEISEILGKLRAEYRNDMAYIPEPHITLKYPFIPKVDLASVDKSLLGVAEEAKPFMLSLRGIGYFEKLRKVAFIRIENKETIILLHSEIIKHLQGQVSTQFEERFDQEGFHPHVTIGENISDSVFPGLKSAYSLYQISYEVQITSFSLFSDAGGVWRSIEIFNFR